MTNAHAARPFLESVLPALQGDERYWGEAFVSEGGPVPRISLHVRDLTAFFAKHFAASDVYFSPVAFKSAGKGRRGNNVARCRVVWADIDVGVGKAHAAVADAIAALKAFPLKPTWVISSGRGVHVYWLLAEEVEEDDFPRLMAVVRGLALHLGGDLAATLRTQILRPPGTLNHKPGGPYPVEVLHHFSGIPELGLDDFEEYITPDPEPAFRERDGNNERSEWDGPPANLERIVKGCAWLRHARDDATRLAEPEWYAMLSIVARSDGGEDGAHEWSRPHPGYSARETDAKIHHALESSGPRTCEAIRSDFGADWCNGCAFRDRAKSPIQIGSGAWADRPGRSWQATSGPAAEQPMPAELPPAPTYPVDALPPIVRTYVLGAAASLGIEPDMIATAILPIAAAVLGNGVSIELKRGWTERPQVWAANVGEPGTAKSPAHRFAMVGVNALQAAAHKRYREEWERYEQDVATWAAAKPAARGAKPQEPSERHFFSSDATIEAVAPMLMGSTRGLLLEHDELAGWLKGMDSFKAQGRGKERQQHLSLWDGQAVKVDRKGRPSIYLEEPVVSVVGGIQPDRLPDITGGQRDGFPDRILWAYPETQVVGWTDAEVPERSTAEYVALFQRLACLSGKYRLSVAALAAWKEWDRENVAIMKEEENVTRGMAAKLPRQLARVALILHSLGAHEPEAEVSADTLGDAIAIIEYHREMARRVLGGSGSTRQAGLRDRVLRILRDAHGVEVCSFARLHALNTFESNSSLSNYLCLSRRDLLARLGGHVPAADLTPVLDALVAGGVVVHHETEPGPRGGVPGSHFSLTRANEQTEQTSSDEPGVFCREAGCHQIVRPSRTCPVHGEEGDQ